MLEYLADYLAGLKPAIQALVQEAWRQRIMAQWPWLLAGLIGALGVTLAAVAIARLLTPPLRKRWQKWVESRTPRQLGYREAWQRMRAGIERRTYLQRALDQTAKAWREAGIPIDPIWVWAGQGALAALGATFSIMVLKNPQLAALLAVVGWMLPQQFLRAGTERIRQAIQRDLVQAFHYFATEFQHSRHVARALQATAERLPAGRVRDVMEHAARRMAAGENYEAALNMMAADFRGHPYGVLFAQLCRLAVKDSSAGAMFSSLVVRMNERILMERRARAAMGGVKLLSMILNILVVPAALAAVLIVPSGYDVYVNTTPGRWVLFAAVVLMLVGFMINRNAARVPDF